MNKVNLYLNAVVLFVAGAPSVFAASPGSTSSVLTISGTITSSTCITKFPDSVSIPAITQGSYEAATSSAQLGSDVMVGNVQFIGCGGDTLTLKANAATGVLSGDASKGTFSYANSSAGTSNPLYYTLGYSDGTTNGNFKLDGSSSSSFTVNTAEATRNVPLTLKVMKNGETLSDINEYVGNFSATVTYTADYK